MTDEKNKKARERLYEVFVQDILEASDEDIVAEFVEGGGDVVKNASEMRALFQKAVLLANKKRMRAARTALSKNAERRNGGAPVDIAEARRRLRGILERAADEKLTLAARKESELSDADVLGMLEDYDDLHTVKHKDGEDGGR
jgi:hypothetical protein